MNTNETPVHANDTPAAHDEPSALPAEVDRLLTAYVTARATLARLGANIDRLLFDQMSALQNANRAVPDVNTGTPATL